jgi:hypothetical protein
MCCKDHQSPAKGYNTSLLFQLGFRNQTLKFFTAALNFGNALTVQTRAFDLFKSSNIILKTSKASAGFAVDAVIFTALRRLLKAPFGISATDSASSIMLASVASYPSSLDLKLTSTFKPFEIKFEIKFVGT